MSQTAATRGRKKTGKERSQQVATHHDETVKVADDEQPKTAKLFMHGRSQAVRLPKEFRFPGKEVRVRRFGGGILIEPVEFDVKAWFARLDSYGDVPFMPEGREQPEMPPDDEIDFDK